MKAYVKPCVKYNNGNQSWMSCNYNMDKYADCVIPVRKVEDINYQL